MDKQALFDELNTLIEQYLCGRDIQLIDLIYRYEGRNLFLRILVDRPSGGITIDECASLNRDISGLLEEKNILDRRYILEVSSPGLDRPLKTKNDFLRCINRKVRFFLAEPKDGKLEMEGVIHSVNDELVCIEREGLIIPLALDIINKAVQVIEDI